MTKISIQAAHEQVNPKDLLSDVITMDEEGIQRCWTSDHYMPWWDSRASGGAAWPCNAEKFERLKEAIYLIKKLWTGDWVNFRGNHYWVKDSKLYTKPSNHIPLYLAGIGKQSAR